MFRRIDPIPAPLLESDLALLAPSRELRTLERLGTCVRFERGRTVVRENAVGRECMVVIDGSFAVERRDVRLAEVSTGGFFGEVALLTHRRRNATITALEDSSVYVFNRGEFFTLLRECPAIAAYVRSSAHRRAVLVA